MTSDIGSIKTATTETPTIIIRDVSAPMLDRSQQARAIAARLPFDGLGDGGDEALIGSGCMAWLLITLNVELSGLHGFLRSSA